MKLIKPIDASYSPFASCKHSPPNFLLTISTLTPNSSDIVLIVLNILVCILVLTQAMLLFNRRLRTLTMLVMQTTTAAYWTACTIIEILGLARILPGGTKTVLDFIFTLVAT